jgi:hypothetical protein
MGKITVKKKMFLIGFVFVWAFIEVACGPASQRQKRKETPAKKVVVPKKPTVSAVKKHRKKKKPEPVFQAQATITLADGNVYEVGDFAFYSNHRGFGGGFYQPSSGNKKWPFYFNQGALWKKIDFSRVKSLTFSKMKGDYRQLNINMLLLDGTLLKGSHPLNAYNYLWTRYGTVYLAGNSKVLGRIGHFKCELKNVAGFQRVENEPAGAPGAPPAFKVIYDDKGKNEVTITEPHLRLIWTRSTPKYLTTFKLKTDMPVTVNNTDIKIKPQEIESVTVPQKSSLAFTVKMKQGETVKIKKLPPRVFGKLENGDVIFTDFFNRGKPVVKEVRLK